jgi:hypothetical protein
MVHEVGLITRIYRDPARSTEHENIHRHKIRSLDTLKVKGKGKGHPRTGHEGPEGGVDV